MLGQQFYHSTTRKLVVAIGTLFNNIYVSRSRNGACEVSDANNSIVFRPNQDKITSSDVGKQIAIRSSNCFFKTTIASVESPTEATLTDTPTFAGTRCYYELKENNIKVPCSYSPREKFIRRFEEQRDINNIQTQIILPRIGFELAGMRYDERRKLNKIQRIAKQNNCNEEETLWSYQRVPYNFTFKIYVQTKYLDDMYQITEQAAAFFSPEFSVTINDNPDLNLKSSVPFILSDVSQEDSYDGSMGETRYIISTLTVTAKAFLYGPTNSTTQGIIKKAIIQFFDGNWDCDNLEEARKIARMVVEPTEITFTTDVSFVLGETIILRKNSNGIVSSDSRKATVKEINGAIIKVSGPDMFSPDETLIGETSGSIGIVDSIDDNIAIELFNDATSLNYDTGLDE